jgi:archaellum component FlaC
MATDPLVQINERLGAVMSRLDGFEKRLKRIEDFFEPPIDPKGPNGPNDSGPTPMGPGDFGRQLNGLRERLDQMEQTRGATQQQIEEIKETIIRMEVELSALQEAIKVIDRAAGAAF